MGTNRFLNKDWQNAHLKQIKQGAGNRYTPKLNVDLPIAEIFEGISRTEKYYFSIRKHRGQLSRVFNRVSSKFKDTDTQRNYNDFNREITKLIFLISSVKEYNTESIPWAKINRSAEKSKNLAWRLIDKLRSDSNIGKKSEQNKSEDFSSDRHYLNEVQSELRFFSDLSSSTKAALSNKSFLLLTGIAGTGKTHLLCDVVKNRQSASLSLPSILVFGELFQEEGDPWQQIIEQLGERLGKETFLRLLNNAGRKANCRSLLIIDALNETAFRKYWRKNLNGIVEDIRKYPNIALVISVRSGFEDDVLTQSQRKSFIHQEHHGFQFKEWEAVNKFFQEFNLPLPEIPLLLPDFQNPLFLLLFCKAFKKRAKTGARSGRNKQIFRGHEGATYIFETFVDSVSKQLSSKYGISSGAGKNIWDCVIEKIAAEMVEQNNDRIDEGQVIDLVKAAYPSVNHSHLILDLERNLLLVKVPRYSTGKREYDGFDYRFPFQKFSDHLIGRYLFKKYEKEFGKPNKNLITAKKYFSRRRSLGKFLSRSWNRGIVEALSIQCPEHLKGLEFVEVAPYLTDSYVAREAFVDSLIWRRPDAFSKDLTNTLSYINKKILRTKPGYRSLLNALLSIASVPNHPFNAHLLNQYLSKFNMAERDAHWSTFLHDEFGEQSAIDRLIDWGWSDQSKSYSDESVFLCAVALTWFLTTPNRFVRDKSTKALVSMLTGKLNQVLNLLKEFRDVNDLYLAERLYAVAYGCALRSKDEKDSLKNLAKWVYDTNFKHGSPPKHILLRDYARGIIEVAIQEKVPIRVNRNLISPPYKSEWPKQIPTEKTLRKKYYPEEFFQKKTKERGFLSIWSSVMYSYSSLADFGRYNLDAAVEHWSGRRLGGNEVKPKKLYDSFVSGLTDKQKRLLGSISDPFFGFSDITEFMVSIKTRHIESNAPNAEEERKKEEARQKTRMKRAYTVFENSLSKNKRKLFIEEIKPFIDERGSIRDPLEHFDTRLAQRWVFNRVVQLGWKPELHGEFDEFVNYHRVDRSEHKPERIGKKYQWIALHEFLALLSDNYEFKDERWSDKISKYDGPWQINVRDIDPSCTLKDTHRFSDEIKLNQWRRVIKYNAWEKKLSNQGWLRKKSSLPYVQAVIDIADDNGEEWLLLEGLVEWEQDLPPEEERYRIPNRRLWYLIKSYLIDKKDLDKFHTWAKQQNFMGRWMPESHEFYRVFLGEYPWAASFSYMYEPFFGREEWIDHEMNRKMPTKLLVTDDQYLSSGSHIDCSTEETIRIKLPSKWIFTKMNLEQKYTDGRLYWDETFVSTDISFHCGMNNILIMKKKSLIEFLEKNDLSIVWTLLGEKDVIGGDIGTGRHEGRLEISGSYKLNRRRQVQGSVSHTFHK
ncbi:MAG: AVAST type 2 anti-phage system protein Avs2 [Thermoleophilia bacterium]